MTQASDKLDSLKKEKEKLAALSKSIKSISPKKGVFKTFKKKQAAKQDKIGMKEKSKDQKPEKKRFVFKKSEIKKEKKKKLSFYEQKRVFTGFVNKAGIETEFNEINKKIAIASLVPVVILSIYFIVDVIIKKSFFLDALSLIFSILVFGSAALFLILWVLFFVYVDVRIYQRKKEIETVFPDYLQLTAANINAGMPIDRALWFAIRPRFGILAREMETVAKATMVGENLSHALLGFSNKYDSLTIKRALNLLLEGLESGGEVGDLLTRVANNIRETEIIRKEMAANVTTYVIFILFATLAAAPFLFGLTTVLIVIMQSIMADINISEGGQSFGGIGGMLAGSSEQAISLFDYQLFAVTSICISSIFAAILISIIRKGNAKESLKSIPIYMIIGIVNYLVAFNILHFFLKGFFN